MYRGAGAGCAATAGGGGERVGTVVPGDGAQAAHDCEPFAAVRAGDLGGYGIHFAGEGAADGDDGVDASVDPTLAAKTKTRQGWGTPRVRDNQIRRNRLPKLPWVLDAGVWPAVAVVVNERDAAAHPL